jgi:predicted acetyltransferase
VSALPGHWNGLEANALPADGSGPAHHLVHRNAAGEVDGAAVFRLPWSPDPTLAGALQVEAFEALNLDAYRALWSLLTDFDLTNRVVAARRPTAEPLRWMLANHRAMRVTRARDNLWLRILDVQAALEARAYAVPGSIVLEITDDLCDWNAGRWRLDAGSGGATCTAEAGAEADVTLSVTELGSLYLGAVSPGDLLAAGRIVEHRQGAVSLLGAMLRQDTAPHNAVGF